MNGETLSHIVEQAKLIEILCARIEELEKDMNEFMENEGILWVYTQKRSCVFCRNQNSIEYCECEEQ